MRGDSASLAGVVSANLTAFLNISSRQVEISRGSKSAMPPSAALQKRRDEYDDVRMHSIPIVRIYSLVALVPDE